MSDETNHEKVTQEFIDSERFGNFQKEMDRKLGNTSEQLDKLSQTNEALLSQISNISAQNQAKPTDSDSESDLLYSDPDKWAKLQEEKIEKRINDRIQAAGNAQAKESQVLASLAKDFPELNDANSELSLKAIETFNKLAPEEQANKSVAYRAAINEAAADLGLVKASKRKNKTSDEYDGFTLDSGNYSRKTERAPKLDVNTILFAEAMGMDTEDKALLKRLAQHSKRDFSKYGK